MAHSTPWQPEQSSGGDTRPSVWFFLFVFTAPFIFFLAALGTVSTLEKWHIVTFPAKENAQVEYAGQPRWIPQEVRTTWKHKVEIIDRAIPAIEGEMQFLEKAIKEEEARAPAHPDPKEYIQSMRRQQQFLQDRIDELRADRAFYLHELKEDAKSNTP